MNKYELIQELWKNYQREHEIQKELMAYFDKKASTDATFKIGEVVDIYDEDVRMGSGIVNGIFHGLNYGWDAFYVKEYVENPQKFQEMLSDIRYNVKAIRKDGRMSERNAFQRASYGHKKGKYSRLYIDKIPTQ